MTTPEADFDWVAARERCDIGLETAFTLLKEVVRRYVNTRNEQPGVGNDCIWQSFTVDQTGRDFFLAGRADRLSFQLERKISRIVIFADKQKVICVARHTLTRDGECRLVLEPLLFPEEAGAMPSRSATPTPCQP